MVLTKPKFSVKPLTKSRAVSELLLAGIFWGFGFIATIWALQSLSTSAIIFYRFMMAFLISLVFLAIAKTPKETYLHELKLAFIPGIFLWATLFFQTWGLEITTATKSSFITTLYVIIVPVIMWILGKEKLSWLHWFSVALALLGTALIVDLHSLQISAESLNWGDFLTLVCAFAAALSIIILGDRASRTKSPFGFNAFQCMWVALIALIALPWSSKWDLGNLTTEAWIGILSLGIGSSLLAFWLQIRAQRVLSPSVASLLFLAESPIACVFAYFLLSERMTGSQWAGAILIMIACSLTLVPVSKIFPSQSQKP